MDLILEKFRREGVEITYCGEDPVDRSDPAASAGALELTLPAGFCEKARAVWDYLNGAAFIFQYKGRLVVTDESLDLAPFGDGIREAIGCPRWVLDSWDELEAVLAADYEYLKADGMI